MKPGPRAGEESRLKPRLGPAPEGAWRAVSSLTGPSREFTRDSSTRDRECHGPYPAVLGQDLERAF